MKYKCYLPETRHCDIESGKALPLATVDTPEKAEDFRAAHPDARIIPSDPSKAEYFCLVGFHNPERQAEILPLRTGNYPAGWSSISQGRLTRNALIRDLHIGHCDQCGQLFEGCNKHAYCHTCRFWRERIESNKTLPAGSVIIKDGVHHIATNLAASPEELRDTSRSAFRGYDGRTFRVTYLDGTIRYTNDLWHQGTIPERFRSALPDTITELRAI